MRAALEAWLRVLGGAAGRQRGRVGARRTGPRSAAGSAFLAPGEKLLIRFTYTVMF